jgi:GT2 family glycosyltransferase
VIVDNASEDETAMWLQDVARHYPNVKVVLSHENLGFSGGNNLGVRECRGDYIILLNNDTVVTPGWLGRLVRHLENDDKLGLVGPVTNAIGNEACVDVDYDDDEAMLVVSRRYTSAHFRELLYVDNIAFFAVAFRRATWEKTGELDEGFGLGFFEDDDYCRRVAESGLKIAIAEDVFIHHELSASFDLLGARRKQEQFEHSRELFEEKWGAWTPHKYRSRHE